METQYYTKEQKEDMLESFLIIPNKFKKYIKDKDKKIYWIYKIINLENDRVYIGKTIDIRRRALDYINEFCKGYNDRKINQAMNEIGIEKFIMSPLEVAFNPQSSGIKEKYYIDLYDSIKNGYNTVLGSASHHIHHKKHTAVNQTLYSKMSKSKIICAIRPESKEIIFSTGLKLFGDYIDRHKDEVKSAAKREAKLNGYHLYYMNTIDFKKQVEDAISRIQKNSIYSDNKLQYPEFMEYSKYLLNYLRNNKNPDNFEIKFLTQSNTETGYEFKDLNLFFEYYKTIPNNLL